jgi:hypothetical protein
MTSFRFPLGNCQYMIETLSHSASLHEVPCPCLQHDSLQYLNSECHTAHRSFPWPPCSGILCIESVQQDYRSYSSETPNHSRSWTWGFDTNARLREPSSLEVVLTWRGDPRRNKLFRELNRSPYILLLYSHRTLHRLPLNNNNNNLPSSSVGGLPFIGPLCPVPVHN